MWRVARNGCTSMWRSAPASDGPSKHPDRQFPHALDRLPWSALHWLVVAALGITWILDGLEVTLAGSRRGGAAGPARARSDRARRSASPAAPISPARCSARCSSAGSPTGSAARSCSSSRSASTSSATARDGAARGISRASLLFRFLTGAGIGGEYAAINSAIQELIPARAARPHRSRHQRQLLGRRGAGRARLGACCSSRTAVGRELGWRAGLRHRRACSASSSSILRRFLPGEPALADDRMAAPTRPSGRRRDRGARDREQPASAAAVPKAAASRGRAARAHAGLGRAHAAAPLSAPHGARPRADGGAGVLLQRDLLHLRAGARRFYGVPAERSASTSCRSPSAISSGRCCSAACSTRSAASR